MSTLNLPTAEIGPAPARTSDPELTPAPQAEVAAPTNVWVTAWADPVIDKLGHDPRSRYVETYWLGVLGPSTTWLLRSVATSLDDNPEGFELDLHTTARTLGLGMKDGRHSPFMRAMDRACQFTLARRPAPAELQVRRRIPPITQGQLKRLPTPLRESHDRLQQQELEPPDLELERRARRLALTLLEIGEDIDSAHSHIRSWHDHEAVAERALNWAHSRHAQAKAAAPSGPDAA